MLGQYDFLTLEEASQVREKIDELREHWVNRAFGVEPFYTLGTASYLDTLGSNDSFYLENAARMNPILKKNFGFVYDRLINLLSKTLKIPVSYEKKLGLPGFHIFQYSKTFEKPIASIHFDLQFKSHQWKHYKEVDFNNPISFTCPVALPHAGGGLNYWDIFKDNVKETENLDELVASKEKHYISYSIGKLVVHKGLLLHQIAPAKDMTPDDERVTLQGHGILADGEIRLYW